MAVPTLRGGSDTDKTGDTPDPTMTDDSDAAEEDGRMTAPQQPYTNRQVGLGFLVLTVGVLVTFVLPIFAV